MSEWYVIEPDPRGGVWRALLKERDDLPVDARDFLLRATVHRVTVWPRQRRCRIALTPSSAVSRPSRLEVERWLAQLFTHIERVEVDVLSASGVVGDDEPSGGERESDNDRRWTVEGAGDDDDDDYERLLAAYAQARANGNGHVNGPLNGGRAGSAATAEQKRRGGRPSAESGGEGVIKGKPIREEAIPIASLDNLQGGNEPVVVCGEIFRVETRELRRGQVLVEFDITDRTDSVTCKFFADDTAGLDGLAEGKWVKVRGRMELDRFQGEAVLAATDIVAHTPQKRMDTAPVKRVELHLHTKMSSLDGVAEVRDVIRQAAEWGHPAIAITDHGVIHAFPEAYQAARSCGIKLIYGVEGYLTDDPTPGSPTYHIVLLARNRTGLRNLYRLISLSHLHYFYRRPRIPREELVRHREGLIVGSACEAGEVYRSLLNNEDWERVKAKASFYDYLEIQPIGNTRFLVETGRVPDEEALREINRNICRLAEELGRPLVATGDVHFLHPEDEIYRRILMAGHGFDDPEHPTPLYLRTTDEMLEEFAYLGEEWCRKAVIEGPRAIADQCEEMAPVPEGLHPPRIEGAEEKIRTMAWNRAVEWYGDPLPELVHKRLEKELTAIIENGFASLYLLAHLLVKRSLEDGYLVGSRGSVGSSFVATLCQITEVNPLPPHYRCKEGHHVEFILDGSVGAGADLPDAACPRCGKPLIKDGFDIPFEVFMGFHGEKVPDIDLNFSGEYQAEIHRYAEQMLGPENVYRAGTIATIAERSAFGYVRNYLESRGKKARTAEINRLVKGCTGVRRTTGQHPGGLMVVPQGRDIHEFTPVQYPANDRSSGTVTTHFDYNAIHDQLVKLDLLGHDDPTMLRILQDLTGVDVRAIPLDDPATLSLFSGVEALGLDPERSRARVGTLGIPEFGTRFVRQMLEETRPKSFSELIRISGFSHGTNVWTNNAQELIRAGVADLSQAIATRDDIMITLIRLGMEPAQAFRIMEKVRKGKGITDEEAEAILAVGAPSWYPESCRKITYMFPKAHAVAYVMMAFRIAYFKVHYPLAYYAAYFSVNAEHFDAGLIRGGEQALARFVDDVERRPDATAKDKARATVMEVALEALQRGVAFHPVDLYASDPVRFRIENGALRPPLRALQGVGTAAAESIAVARADGPFTSVEDLLRRSKVTRAVADALRENGALGDLPDSDQLQLF